jgi:hypothetical protein
VPKWNSSGILPITAAVRLAINAVHKMAIDPRPEAFVMESLECPGSLTAKHFFQKP